GHGHVVNVASYMGRVPIAGAATYVASKHAIVGLSEAVRDELHGTGVTVTAVLPAAVRTELASGVRLGGVVPTVDPEQIADGIVNTCQHRSAFVPIPGWMRVYEPVAAIVPQPIVGGIRGRLARLRTGDQLDQTARAAYNERVGNLARRESTDH